MVSLMSLWLPIVLSAVAVFVVSSVIHMFLGYHNNDMRKVPDEGKALAAIRSLNLPAGDYGMPRAASMKEMGTPEFQAKMKEGPVVMMTVMPSGSTSMGPQLTQWFLFTLLVSLFGAYVASRTLDPGTTYLEVFRVVGTVTFASYGLANVPASIWFNRAWGTTLRNVLDALIYALVTAGVFGWRWPG